MVVKSSRDLAIVIIVCELLRLILEINCSL